MVPRSTPHAMIALVSLDLPSISTHLRISPYISVYLHTPRDDRVGLSRSPLYLHVSPYIPVYLLTPRDDRVSLRVGHLVRVRVTVRIRARGEGSG